MQNDSSTRKFHFLSLFAGFVIMVVTALVFALFPQAVQAVPDMYVANYVDSTISRADLDGTNADTLTLSPTGTLVGPVGIALDLDEGKIYVSNYDNDTLSRANLDGTNAETLTLSPPLTLHGPYGIALDLDNGKIYVVDRGVTDKIIRADLDGTDATDLGSLAGTLDNPCGIALDLDNSKMYVTNCGNNTISRADLDGTDGESLGDLSNTLDEPQAIALDLDNSKMYVVNGNGDTISCADLNGTNAVTLTLSPALTLYGPTGIALDLDNGHMYVVNSGNLIYRANLDGTDATDLGNLAGTLGNPFGIALDLRRQPSPAAAVPTLSEWGMIILSLLMAGSAILIIRRRKLA